MPTRLVLNGKEINMTSENMNIVSTNFSVDKDGKITATSGTVGGFILDTTDMKGNLDGSYIYDRFDASLSIIMYLEDFIPAGITKDILDVNSDGKANLFDSQKIISNVLNNTELSKKITGTFKIDAKDPKNILTITSSNGEKTVSLGMLGIDTNVLNARTIICADDRVLSDVDANKSFISPDKISTPLIEVGKNSVQVTADESGGHIYVNNNELGVTQTETFWHHGPNGVYHYEGQDVNSYKLPSPYCQVWVARSGSNRGTAIAINWNDDGGTKMWINRLHDDTGSNNWAGWVEK